MPSLAAPMRLPGTTWKPPAVAGFAGAGAGRWGGGAAGFGACGCVCAGGFCGGGGPCDRAGCCGADCDCEGRGAGCGCDGCCGPDCDSAAGDAGLMTWNEGGGPDGARRCCCGGGLCEGAGGVCGGAGGGICGCGGACVGGGVPDGCGDDGPGGSLSAVSRRCASASTGLIASAGRAEAIPGALPARPARATPIT